MLVAFSVIVSHFLSQFTSRHLDQPKINSVLLGPRMNSGHGFDPRPNNRHWNFIGRARSNNQCARNLASARQDRGFLLLLFCFITAPLHSKTCVRSLLSADTINRLRPTHEQIYANHLYLGQGDNLVFVRNKVFSANACFLEKWLFQPHTAVSFSVCDTSAETQHGVL